MGDWQKNMAPAFWILSSDVTALLTLTGGVGALVSSLELFAAMLVPTPKMDAFEESAQRASSVIEALRPDTPAQPESTTRPDSSLSTLLRRVRAADWSTITESFHKRPYLGYWRLYYHISQLIDAKLPYGSTPALRRTRFWMRLMTAVEPIRSVFQRRERALRQVLLAEASMFLVWGTNEKRVVRGLRVVKVSESVIFSSLFLRFFNTILVTPSIGVYRKLADARRALVELTAFHERMDFRDKQAVSSLVTIQTSPDMFDFAATMLSGKPDATKRWNRFFAEAQRHLAKGDTLDLLDCAVDAGRKFSEEANTLPRETPAQYIAYEYAAKAFCIAAALPNLAERPSERLSVVTFLTRDALSRGQHAGARELAAELAAALADSKQDDAVAPEFVKEAKHAMALVAHLSDAKLQDTGST